MICSWKLHLSNWGLLFIFCHICSCLLPLVYNDSLFLEQFSSVSTCQIISNSSFVLVKMSKLQHTFCTCYLLFVPQKLLMLLICCYPCRISYIVMIGQVLLLLGSTRSSMLLMLWQMAELYLPSTILSLEHITLARQSHIVTKLQLWVLLLVFVVMLFEAFIFFHSAHVCLI